MFNSYWKHVREPDKMIFFPAVVTRTDSLTHY